MGQLFSLLKNAPADSINVNIEQVTPNEKELKLYTELSEWMQSSGKIIQQLKEYKGCASYIQKAISTASQEAEQEAWQHLTPCVVMLKQFYEYAIKIEQALPRVLDMLCFEDGAKVKNIAEHLQNYQACTRCMALIIHFSSEFDDLKMVNPTIQNDFSYYRRTLSRYKGQDKGIAPVVSDELANRMSLFYAYPTPLLNVLTNATTTYVNTKGVQSQVTDCLASLARVCLIAVAENKLQNPAENALFCLRVMVASVVLYDHIHPNGVFKSQELNIKIIIKGIQAHGGNQMEQLLNALRFTTKHLNDADTKKDIKSMLGVAN